MLSNQETIYVANTEKFLCFSSKPAQICFCFNVKISSIIFGFITLLGYLANLISAIYSKNSSGIIIWVLFLIYFGIGVIYLILSINHRRADYAYYSYVIFMIDFLLRSICFVVWIFYGVEGDGRSSVIVAYIIAFLIYVILRLDILFIFYSFTRYAALGDWNAVNGNFTGFNYNLNIQLNSVDTGSIIPINSNITNQNTNQNFNLSKL